MNNNSLKALYKNAEIKKNESILKAKKICKEKNVIFVGTKIKNNKTYVLFVCPNHRKIGVQEKSLQNIQKIENICSYCIGRNLTTEDLINHPKVRKNIKIIGCYINWKTPIKCKCRDCNNIWHPTPNKLKQGKGCPKCALEKASQRYLRPQEEFEYLAKKMNPHIQILDKYMGANNKIKCFCKIHNKEFYRTPASDILNRKTGCSKCMKSSGENMVADILDKMNIHYVREKTFDGCKHINKLRFDFYIESLNICIEYQGEQHYKPVNFKGKGSNEYIQEFKNNNIRDNIKRKYCIENSILLIEIPYWEKDNIEQYIKKHIKKP